jgi:ethanolamine utilization protein EutA
LKKLPKNILREPIEGIRATVIGAGEYTIQASGSTTFLSTPDILPAFGLKVVRPAPAPGPLAELLRQAMRKLDLDGFGPGLALAITVVGQQDYQSLRRMAEGIASIVGPGEAEAPLFLILDQDVAKSLGSILRDELNLTREIVAVDGIEVGELDYVDIGRPMGLTEVIPVTVKSLIFPQRSYDFTG